MILLALLGMAGAASPALLSPGASSFYAGIGASTFASGAGPGPRDRQWRLRAEAFGATGLTRRLELKGDLPLVANLVADREGIAPCPSSTCDPVFTVGEAGVELRGALLPDHLALGLGLRSDVWNAAYRGRWTNPGTATTKGVLGLTGGGSVKSWSLSVEARYALSSRRDNAGLGVPADTVSGGLDLGWRGPVELGLWLAGSSRLWGIDYGPGQAPYWSSPDRWASFRYQELRLGGRVGIPLGDLGLWMGGSAILAQRNGPGDALDMSIGLARWWPGRRGRG